MIQILNIFSNELQKMDVDAIVYKGKLWITGNDLPSLTVFWKELMNEREDYPESFDWPTVFQTLYLHACLKGKSDIAHWFQTIVFPHLDPIQQIALRQSFAYGKHLLKTAAKKN